MVESASLIGHCDAEETWAGSGMSIKSFEYNLFRAQVSDTSGAGGLSAAQARVESANFLRHAGSLSMSKISDGLIDPKLAC